MQTNAYHQEKTRPVFIIRLLHTLPFLADAKISHCSNEVQDIHYWSLYTGTFLDVGRMSVFVRTSTRFIGFCGDVSPNLLVFVRTLNPQFVPRSVCSHQRQTRSVPLDWVFVVPPGALVAVGTLQMKDHHSPPDCSVIFRFL